MKNEKLKRKHLVTVRLNDFDFDVLNSLAEKYNLSYSKLLRILLNFYHQNFTLSLNDISDYENK